MTDFRASLGAIIGDRLARQRLLERMPGCARRTIRQGLLLISVRNSLTSRIVTSESDWLWWALAAAGMVAAILFVWIWLKGRAFAAGDVFRASRISAGNHLFPTQVLITPTSVVQY